MRILAVSDTPERLLYDYFSPDEWRGRVDLVVSCGDLDREYLEFLVTELTAPLLYVAGNHDMAFRARPPEGCADIDGRLVRMGGLRIAGAAGSMRYNADPDAYQFTERQMAWKMRRLGCKARRAGGVDIVVSHAAPLHQDSLLDATDWSHRGSLAFRRFIARYQPRYWLHGHNHLTYSRVPRVSFIDKTVVVNTYGHYLLDTDAPAPAMPIAADASTLLRPS